MTKLSTVVQPCAPEVLAGVTRVSKCYGATTALEHVSFTLRPAEIVALLGPNGAGKSTLFQLLLGLTRPDEGSITLFGRDPRAPSARRALGSTLQQSGFPDALTVREVAELVQAHYPVRSDARDLLGRFGLGSSLERQVGGLSGGQQRTLAAALAFAGQPELVLLDENPPPGSMRTPGGGSGQSCAATPTRGAAYCSLLTIWRKLRRSRSAPCCCTVAGS